MQKPYSYRLPGGDFLASELAQAFLEVGGCLVVCMLPVLVLSYCHARLGAVVSVPCSSGLLCILCTGDQVH